MSPCSRCAAFVLVVLLGGVLAAPAAASTVVYQCGLNLCAVAPDGSGSHQVTTDGTQTRPYTWPSLSHDGTRMSWIRNGDLYLGSAQAAPAVGPIVRSAQFARLRPDGAQVAALVMSFVFTGDFLYVYDAAGATLISGPRPANYSAGWAPDGSVLVPWLGTPKIGICTIAESGGVWSCAARVADDPAGDLNFPAVSPNGALLAVDDGGRIAIFDYAARKLLRHVTAGPTDTTPAWSPDSSSIAFQRGSGAATEVRVVGADGTGERLLAGAGAQTPTWGGPADSTSAPQGGTSPTITVTRAQRGTRVRATVRVPTAGSRILARLTIRGGIVAGTLTRRAVSAGRASLTIALNTRGRAALRRTRVLKLTLRVTVTPPSGRAVVITRAVSLRR